MKKTYVLPAIIILFILLMVQGIRISFGRFVSDGFSVLVLYNPVLDKANPGILGAYENVLKEEGVPYQSVTPAAVLSRTFESILEKHPVIIIPDTIAQALQEDVRLWLINYLTNGGKILVVYDVGIKDRHGAYLKDAALVDLLGFNYMNYEQWREKTYTRGFLQFKDTAGAEFFGISTENLDGENFAVVDIDGKRERLESPVSRIEMNQENGEEEIYAHAVITGQGKMWEQEKYPAFVSSEYGRGKLLYVNLPLGYLSVYVDGLPLRAVLKTYLFKMAEIPFLQRTEPPAIDAAILNISD
ncbi:MAG: hypothetical protein JW957_02975 [Candidatus Omnitrophica bacterium]|nr:hypothetical protein [Candidatus Omnitrophota bacterium]